MATAFLVPPRRLLPITAGLRARIQEWVEDYTQSILSHDKSGEQRALEHDRLGYALSQELQAELGDDYLVQYGPRSRYGQDDQLPRRVSLFALSDDDLEELPDLPQDLRGRLLEWLGERSRFEHAPDETPGSAARLGGRRNGISDASCNGSGVRPLTSARSEQRAGSPCRTNERSPRMRVG